MQTSCPGAWDCRYWYDANVLFNSSVCFWASDILLFRWNGTTILRRVFPEGPWTKGMTALLSAKPRPRTLKPCRRAPSLEVPVNQENFEFKPCFSCPRVRSGLIFGLGARIL